MQNSINTGANSIGILIPMLIASIWVHIISILNSYLMAVLVDLLVVKSFSEIINVPKIQFVEVNSL
jgi:ABC-type bacteriocin/lantibiotic exporter with double-glycine peptidase domain